MKKMQKSTQVQASNPPAGWSVHLLQDEQTGLHKIRLVFPLASGNGHGVHTFLNELRLEPKKVQQDLLNKNAALPAERSIEFVQRVLSLTPNAPTLTTAKPGFRPPRGFVSATAMYGSANGTYEWDGSALLTSLSVGARSGTVKGFNSTIGSAALHSPILTLCILLALASGLPSYVRMRKGSDAAGSALMSEPFILHLCGPSTTFKTTAARCCAAVQGEPRPCNWNITSAAAAELASSHNDHALILDDLEKLAVEGRDASTLIRSVIQLIGAGQSKVRSKKVTDMPTLTWSLCALSTGTRSFNDMTSGGRQANTGQPLRGVDLIVPDMKSGGIFGTSVRAEGEEENGIDELKELMERGLRDQYGVLLPEWITYLLKHDVSDRILELVNHFEEAIASMRSPFEKRLARKFGLIYAAGRLAQDAKLLTWPKNWPRKALRYCFDNAVRALPNQAAAYPSPLSELRGLVKDNELFPKWSTEKKPIVPPEAAGFRVGRDGSRTLFLKLECVPRLLGCGERKFVQMLKDHGVLLERTNRSATIQRRVLTEPAGPVRKIRFLVIDWSKLKESLQVGESFQA